MKLSKGLWLSIAMIFLCAVCLPGCTSGGTQETENGGISIVTTNFPAYDFARAASGDAASVKLLLKPGTESHSYEPSPADIISIKNCDLFICVGGESESWLDSVFESASLEESRILRFMDCVETSVEEIKEGMDSPEHDEHEDGHGDEPEYDEHVWTSLRNSEIILDAIGKRLADIDKQNAQLYVDNVQSYVSKIEELDAEFTALTDGAKRNTLIFGDRFPFRYFAEDYKLDYYAAFPGCSEQTEPSAKTVAFLIDEVKEKQIPVVFYIEFSNHKLADTICDATGAKALMLHSCHNVTAKELSEGTTYIDLMKSNVEKIREALY